jgi:Calx-beta domain/Bacterial pre-peptidase C-terminal domain
MKKIQCLVWLLVLGLFSTLANAQLLGNYSGTLTKDYQVATHSFTTTADGDLFITITTGPDLNLLGGVALLDSDGTTSLFGDSQYPGTTVTHHITALRAGTYSLRLTKDSRDFYFGPYSASVTLRACQIADTAGNNDTKATAKLLAFDTTVSGHLGFRGQQKDPRTNAWFRVVLPYDGSLKLDVTKSGGGASPVRETDGDFNFDPSVPGFRVLDADGVAVMYSTYTGENTSTHTATPLRAGTYYVQIVLDSRTWYYWGSYTLRAKAIPTVATGYTKVTNNFSVGTAHTLLANQNVTGLLAYRGQMKAPDMRAWFRVSLPQDGTLSVYLSSSSTSEPLVRPSDGDLNFYWGLSLLGADGTTEVSTIDPSSSALTRYDFTGLKAGTYYIRLTNDGGYERYWYYWGSYTLRWAGIPDAPPLVFTFGAPSYSVYQTSGSIRIPVKYVGTPVKPNVWVKYKTQDRTAVSGIHYTGTSSATLNFEGGMKTAYITIPIRYTGSKEDKTFMVNLITTSEGGTGVPAGTAVTIRKQAARPAVIFKTKTFTTGLRAVQGTVANAPLKDIRKVVILNGSNSFDVIGKSPWSTEKLKFSKPGAYEFTAVVTLRNGMKISRKQTIMVTMP